MFGRLEVKVPLPNLPDNQSDGDLRFEYDLMTKLLEAFDVITGQTLGFEAIEEVTAQINVAGSVFQKVKGERGQECGGSTSGAEVPGVTWLESMCTRDGSLSKRSPPMSIDLEGIARRSPLR
jgi:hypothetical protein